MTFQQYQNRKLLARQLKGLDKKEGKALIQKEPSLLQRKLAPVLEKTPEKVTATLEKVFEKAFKLVLDKAPSLIGKTCGREEGATPAALSRMELTRRDIRANAAAFCNISISSAEGAALGLFGIGMPDIPIFLGLVFRSIYEISLRYGYDYRAPGEEAFQLLLIASAVGDVEIRRKAISIDHKAASRAEAVSLASAAICTAMLGGKVVQGIPIVGVCGGLQNGLLLSKISRLACIRYKRRFLLRSKE